MGFERLPRRLLSAWVPGKRPAGAPKMTYGRTLGKALKKFNITSDTWHELAAERGVWRETLRLGYPAIRRSVRIAKRPRAQLPAALIPRQTAPAAPLRHDPSRTVLAMVPLHS